jgi:hypothetical protein
MNTVPSSTMLDQLGQVLVLPLGQRLERREQRASEWSQRVSRFVGSWPGDPVSLDEAGAKVPGQGRIQAVVVDAL